MPSENGSSEPGASPGSIHFASVEQTLEDMDPQDEIVVYGAN